MKRSKNCLSLVLCLATFCGCHYDIFSKRRSELCCPTDIRQMHPFSWGEDAVIHSPCGPDAEFYGLKPTSWRVWPTSAAQWRDAYGAVITEPETWVDGESVMVDHLPQPAPNETLELANPFRDDPQVLPAAGGNQPSLVPPDSSRIERSVDSVLRTVSEPDHKRPQRQLSSRTKRVATPSSRKKTSTSKKAAADHETAKQNGTRRDTAKRPTVPTLHQPPFLQATPRDAQLKGEVVANRQEFQKKRLSYVAFRGPKPARPSVSSEADQKLPPRRPTNRLRLKKSSTFVR